MQRLLLRVLKTKFERWTELMNGLDVSCEKIVKKQPGWNLRAWYYGFFTYCVVIKVQFVILCHL